MPELYITEISIITDPNACTELTPVEGWPTAVAALSCFGTSKAGDITWFTLFHQVFTIRVIHKDKGTFWAGLAACLSLVLIRCEKPLWVEAACTIVSGYAVKTRLIAFYAVGSGWVYGFPDFALIRACFATKVLVRSASQAMILGFSTRHAIRVTR